MRIRPPVRLVAPLAVVPLLVVACGPAGPVTTPSTTTTTTTATTAPPTTPTTTTTTTPTTTTTVPPTRPGDDSAPDGYGVVFADEFDGSQLDRSAWCTRYIYGGGPAPQTDPACGRNGDGNLDFLNDEQQRYVDTNSRGEQMHVLGDGYLRLRAT